MLADLACPNLPLEPILATEKMEESRIHMGQRQVVEVPAVVNRPLQQSLKPNSTGCVLTAVEGQGAFQAALFAEGDRTFGCQATTPQYLSPIPFPHPVSPSQHAPGNLPLKSVAHILIYTIY